VGLHVKKYDKKDIISRRIYIIIASKRGSLRSSHYV